MNVKWLEHYEERLVVSPAVSGPYADCERMDADEYDLTVNRRFTPLRRKVNFNTNPVQVQRVSHAEYHFAGHRHDPAVSSNWANVDQGKIQAEKQAKKGKKK